MKALYTICFVFIVSFSFAQESVEFLIKDVETDEVLIGASLKLANGEGGVTDVDGKVTLAISQESFPIIVSYLGYENMKVTFSDYEKGDANAMTLLLTETPSVLDIVTVSSSPYEKNLADEAVSIEVIRPEIFENNYVTSLADVIEKVPGVQVMDDQVNIRSSGYSYGTGSRVAVILDGQPLLGGLENDIKWGYLPVENIEQVEVTKGAASVLYGSAAVNGVINIRSAQPTNKPYTTVTLYGGQMDDPPSIYRKWWNDGDSIRPMTRGFNLAHRQRFGKLDVVFGGNFHKEYELIETVSEVRYRGNLNLRYRLNDRINFGVNYGRMYTELVSYIIWQDADTNALQPIEPNTPERYWVTTIDPYLNYYTKNNNKHSFKARHFNAVLVRGENKPDAPASTGSLEYSYLTELGPVKTTFGAFGQYFNAQIPKASRFDSTAFDVQQGKVAAAFAQGETSFLDDKLNLTLGLRLERYAFDSSETKIIPISRVGATYKVNDLNVFRMNFGQGYRIPSLIERYSNSQIFRINAPVIEGIYFIQNVDIQPEIGQSFEVGFKKLFNDRGWDGYFDVALFQNDYDNLTEVLFDFYGETLIDDPEQLGFKVININSGRIAGVELSSFVKGKVGGMPLRFWGGYSYTYPANMDTLANRGETYYGNFFKAFVPDSSITNTILPYSTLHTARLDLELELKPFTIGWATNFFGYVHKVEDYFDEDNKWNQAILEIAELELFPGFNDFRESSKGGAFVHDLRIAVRPAKFMQLHFIIKNVMNNEYAARPGRMNDLRSFNAKVSFRF